MKKTIAVFFGGKSSEHDVSIITAHQTMEVLNRLKYEVVPVYITKEGVWLTSKTFLEIKGVVNFDAKGKPPFKVAILPSNKGLFKIEKNKFKKLYEIDVALLATHGGAGEDGTLQGVLEASGIPCTSCEVLSSAICMDKVMSKQIFKGLELPILPWFYIYKNQAQDLRFVHDKIRKSFGYPAIVKPSSLGSSIGISVCKNKKELEVALFVASCYDHKILIEQALVDFREVNCSVLGLFDSVKTSSLEEPISLKQFLSFEDKYLSLNKIGENLIGKTDDIKKEKEIKEEKENFLEKNPEKKLGMASLKRILPANLTPLQEAKIKEFSEIAFRGLECSGVVRIDFLIDKKTQEIYINEINTIPGSMSFYLWQHKGLKFSGLMDEIIELALKKQEIKQNIKYVYNSNILKNFTQGAKFK